MATPISPLRRIVWRGFAYVMVWGWSVFTAMSLLWLVLSSLKSKREVLRTGLALPAEPQFANFSNAWMVGRLGDYFINSLVVVSLSVVAILVVAAPAAYVLARARFAGRQLLTNIFIIGMGIPIPLLFIPLFGMLAALHLTDTLYGLGLVFVATSLPFTIYVLTGFFSSLPRELEMAAIMEGCSDLQVFTRVMLPLARPGLLTAATFNFIWLWNEYQMSLVLLTSSANRTLPLGLYGLQNAMQYSGDWPGLFAGVTIVIVPTIIVYALLSERMISGMTTGALK